MRDKKDLPRAISSDLWLSNGAMIESPLKTDVTICYCRTIIHVHGTNCSNSLGFIFVWVWKCTCWSFHEIRPLLQGMHPIRRLGLHEQFLKEEMKTHVLGTLGLWLSVEVSSGHP